MVDASETQKGQLEHTEQLKTHYFCGKGRKDEHRVTRVLHKVNIRVDTFLFITYIWILVDESHSVEGLADLKDNGVERNFGSLTETHEFRHKQNFDVRTHNFLSVFKSVSDYSRRIEK